MTTSSDPVLHSGLSSTLNRAHPTAISVAATDRTFARIATTADVKRPDGQARDVIDVTGRRVLAGLIDNHHAGGFASLDAAPASLVIPDCSPVRHVGGYRAWRDVPRRSACRGTTHLRPGLRLPQRWRCAWSSPRNRLVRAAGLCRSEILLGRPRSFMLGRLTRPI